RDRNVTGVQTCALPISAGGNSYGRVWVRLGSTSDSTGVNSQETSWDIPSNLVGNVRESWMAGDDRAVPTALRGRKIPVGLRGRVDRQSGVGGERGHAVA